MNNQNKNRSSNERVEDMHLLLSEKYQTYKDLADRCLINTSHIDKGDKRVFYLKPDSIFLEEPRLQNSYRNEFVKLVSTPPTPEPFTLFADDLHRDFIELIQDKSNPSITKQDLANFFKRRQYKLQHKKYKLLQRWAHHALTSELVDKVSLKFSPTYSKLQFEMENAVKRYSRLEGEDHFLNVNRPQTSVSGEKPLDEFDEKINPLSSLRIDDIDVYLRITTYEQKINKDAEHLIQRVKWTPMSHRFEIFQDSIEYFQQIRQENLSKQREFLKKIEQKGSNLIQFRKLGIVGQQELKQIIDSQVVSRFDRRASSNGGAASGNGLRDRYIDTCKYNYERPKVIIWNDLELKLQLQERSAPFGIHGDLEIDNGHSFAYSIMVFFPTYYQTQVIKSQFAIYDAVPALIDPTTLAKKNIQQVLDRNRKKYGNNVSGKNTLLERLEIKAKEEQLNTEFINSVEKALFGEFNAGQIKDFPSVRLKKSAWIQYVCYEPVLSNEQKYQASILAGDSNPIDDSLKLTLDLLNVQDVTNVNLILESLSSIHHDKVKHGEIKTEFLLQHAFLSEQDLIDKLDSEHVFSEGERSFLSIFKGCLKTKSDYDSNLQQSEDLHKHSLLQVPQHLLFSLYMLKFLSGRDSKIKLLYMLNAFRAIQKRVVIELREMGTRDRILGDVNFLGPMENMQNDLNGQDNLGVERAGSSNQGRGATSNSGTQPDRQTATAVQSQSKFTETSYSAMYNPTQLASEGTDSKFYNKYANQKAQYTTDNEKDEIDIINDHLIDIQKIKFNSRFQNFVFSTCPIIPRFHSTFGEPMERQEISAELENNRKADNKKEEGMRLMGRVDNIYYDENQGYYMVKDDFGVHIMFDCALLDMRNLEQEVLKICSFYLSKQEPLLEHLDLRYIFPSVDRFELLDDLFSCELSYHQAKLELSLTYLECLEHISDTLEQQRMIQIIVDLMAQRPKLNLNATHFRDSYKAEVENLKLQNSLIREVIRMQMRNEFDQNNYIREYLERTYRLIMEQVENKIQYQRPETLDSELKNRENLQKGLVEQPLQSISTQPDILAQESVQTQDTNTNYLEGKARRQSQENVTEAKPQVFSAKFSDPKEFANYLGIPFASLQMLMKDYKERDPLVRQSIHEHVSFIKIEEGYPIYMYDMSSKQNNTLSFTKDSQKIGILDFYESMHIIVKVVAAMQIAVSELNEAHRPDNGLTSTAIEIAAYRFFLSELKVIKGEKTLTIDKPTGMNYLEDDSILGNPDKMMFYSKELLASAEDQQSSHNPYILTKLNLKTIDNFSFDVFQKLIQDNANTTATGSIFQDANAKQRKITTHHAYRFFPKLKTRAQKVFMPTMLFLSCNSIEMLRLRHILVSSIIQKKILEEVYERQVKLLSKDGRIYFKDQFNFEHFIQLGEKNYINFVDDGPATGIEIDLAINEFDPSLRSAVNFSDPDGYKAMICPLGLEELRAVVFYELMNLQTLIVATRTNQILLDYVQRYMSELELFAKGYVVANPVFDYYVKFSGSNLLESNFKKLHVTERSMILSQASSKIGDIYYNIISRKNRNRSFVEKHFQKCRVDIINSQDKHETQLRKIRTFRLSLLEDYCQDILSEVYGDAVKLQLLVECDQLRKRSYLLPKESNIFELAASEYGEFQCAHYQIEHTQESGTKLSKFLEKGKKKIRRLWRIPNNKEIVRLPSTYEQVRQTNLSFLFQLEIDPKTKKMTPNFSKNSQHKLLRQRVPKLKMNDLKDTETIYRDKQRLVEFENAYSYQHIFNSNQLLNAQQSPYLLSILFYFTSLQNLFDLELFQNKIGSHAQTISTLERNVLSGLPFWEEGDETLFNQTGDSFSSHKNSDAHSPTKNSTLQGFSSAQLKNLGANQHQTSDKQQQLSHRNNEQANRNVVADIGYKNDLSNHVIERITREKKHKLTLHQELESIKDKFNELESIMYKLELKDDIMRAAIFLNEQAHLTFYGIFSSLTGVQSFYQKESKSKPQKELMTLSKLIGEMSHLNDVKTTYTNGFHVNTAITKTLGLNLDENNIMFDFDQWQRSAQPIIDENALAPSQFTLISSMFEQSAINLKTYKKNKVFMGKMPSRDYQYLDYSMINVDKNMRRYIYSNFISVDAQLKEYLKIKFNHEDQYFVGNLNQYFDLMLEKKQYLKTLLKSRQLKRIAMILLGDCPVPNDLEELNRLQIVFNEEVQWKINTKWDDFQINKIKRQEKEQIRRSMQVVDKFTASQINSAMKKKDESMNSNIISQLELAQVEIEVLSNEVQRFLIQSSFTMLDKETSALARSFELNGKHFEFYIHPCQQFASTRDQKTDKRNHLDIINKVSIAQKFLTQIRNRCLEIETITSGVGMVISQKDLNECIEEACRSIIKTGEVEMRSRCETFAMQQVQYENLIYIKDRQLLNMEEKLKHAKKELDKIIRTKVFSKGNQLVYELDTTTRQLRLLKDNVFEMEKKLSDKIRLEFDRELNQRQMELDEGRRKFAEFQINVNSRVMADVRDNVNNIDALMKNKAEYFKDLSKNTNQSTYQMPQTSSSFMGQQLPTTINISNLTIKNIQSLPANSSGLMNQSQVQFQQQPMGMSSGDQAYFQRVITEFEVLKQNEKESREEVIKLQEVIRKMRMLERFKTVLLKQKYENKLDNMRDQLNSNQLLWEQLAEGEKREKVLKRELEQSQQEIVTQEKIIEQLKDELKRERGDKMKLIQYKQTKSRRLEELEGKAREFEVLQNLNLPKVLNLLETKEDKIHELKSKEKLQEAHLQQMEKLKHMEIKNIKKKFESEVRMKSEAMNKLETLRHELHMIEGTDQQAVEVWKDKCRKLIEICKSFKEENDKLQTQMQLVGGDSELVNMSLNTGRIRGLQDYQNRMDELQISENKASGLAQVLARDSNNQNLNMESGIGSSYLKKQTKLMDKRNASSIIREEAKEENEFTTTQGSIKSSHTQQHQQMGIQKDISKNSGKNSSRFKLKKELSNSNKYSFSIQNQIQQMNQSLDNPYLGIGSQVNMSTVLAGNNGAFTGQALGLPSQIQTEKLSHSFVDSQRRDHSVDVGALSSGINQRSKKMSHVQQRGQSTKDIHSSQYNINTRNHSNLNNQANIFSGKPQDEDLIYNSSPKTPSKTFKHQEFESHSSSVYGKLTPVYDPKLALTQQQKRAQQNNQYSSQLRNKDSNVASGALNLMDSKNDNVFSSLAAIQANNQMYFTQGSTNIGGQSSQDQLNGISVADPYLIQQSRNIQLQGASNTGGRQNQIHQISLMGQRFNNTTLANPIQSIPSIGMNHNLNNGDRSTRNHNQTHLTGAMGGLSLGITNISTSLNEVKNNKDQSSSQVRSKVVQPPKALQKDLDRPGFKGQLVKKQPSHGYNNEVQF